MDVAKKKNSMFLNHQRFNKIAGINFAAMLRHYNGVTYKRQHIHHMCFRRLELEQRASASLGVFW